MSTEKYHGKESAKISTFRRLQVSMGKLQNRFSLSAATKEAVDSNDFDEEEKMEVPTIVPDDVKEGHFAVFAAKGAEKKRFIVKLECLNSPTFLRLLEQAEEEYGFEQTGALVVPCRPEELHRILGRHDQGDQIGILGR
ncbi:hypothetical protein L484_024347 [Morus notabilis]|uniref:Uncharacterized protein n=1 Tax=Morus notabilis TaxID=981085 RepID=W9S7M5_9ROSA|nr:uncharacterized protein LOC21407092 [Morus notabilis]EXC16179.1 hypothetical protein L484_024347 [Morus notabilis]